MELTVLFFLKALHLKCQRNLVEKMPSNNLLQGNIQKAETISCYIICTDEKQMLKQFYVT